MVEIERKRPLKVAGGTPKSKGMSRSAGLSFYPLMAGAISCGFPRHWVPLDFPWIFVQRFLAPFFPIKKS